MIQQSQFSRTLWNDAKLGAYYTEVGHCSRIGRMFCFSEETCVLEPSVGDANAIIALLGSAEIIGQCYTFGVEVNAESHQAAQSYLDFSLNADFLNGTRISNKVFSFCFANPPYGSIGVDGKERLETKFVERIHSLMKADGYLVLVVSFPTMQIEKFSRSLIARFSCEQIYRFDDAEYTKHKQVVFIGTKRANIGILKAEYESFHSDLIESNLPYLPGLDEPVDVMSVPGSQEKNIEFFTTREFRPEIAGESLLRSNVFSMVEKEHLSNKYQIFDIGQPPLPLKKDLMYLCAISGVGQGLAGSEDTQDLHLQRGFAKRVQNSLIDYDEEKNAEVEVVRQYSQIGLNIIDNFGNVIELSE